MDTPPTALPPRERDFYQKLRREIRAWLAGKGTASTAADWLLLAPDFFHLLVRLNLDPVVPKLEKLRLGMAIVYFISPFDLIPEAFVGPVGWLDDLLIAAEVLSGFINRGGAPVASRHWAGDQDLLDLLQRVLDRLPRLLRRLNFIHRRFRNVPVKRKAT